MFDVTVVLVARDQQKGTRVAIRKEAEASNLSVIVDRLLHCQVQTRAGRRNDGIAGDRYAPANMKSIDR
jgi:hypothetical protein